MDGESGGGTPDVWGVQERRLDRESRRGVLDAESRKGGWMRSPGEESWVESPGEEPQMDGESRGVLDGWGIQRRSSGW